MRGVIEPRWAGTLAGVNYQLRTTWRDARVAESDGLENRCGCMPTVGSNPTPSAAQRVPL